MNKKTSPKVLLIDIETAPILAYVWKIWDENIGLNQIKQDWHIISFAAKWLDDPSNKIIYKDQRNNKKIENDIELLKSIWNLLDEADIIITQNGKSFDQKKINARFIFHGMKPPSSYKHIDTLRIAKKHFAFTSNKLEYMSDKLCTTYKKQKHKNFSGFDLWKECLAGNKKAWQDMEKYNKYDVLALEELYKKLIPWDNSINFEVYQNSSDRICTCGNNSWHKNGFAFTSVGKYQRYTCTKCGSEVRDKQNLLDKDTRKFLKVGTVR